MLGGISKSLVGWVPDTTKTRDGQEMCRPLPQQIKGAGRPYHCPHHAYKAGHVGGERPVLGGEGSRCSSRRSAGDQ